MIKLVMGAFCILMLSCNGTKETTEKPMDASSTSLQSEKMMEEGFTSGIITTSKKEGDCDVMIKVTDGRYFESTDIPEDFAIDGKKVWFKFTPLRRMSRCQNANPIAIQEIKMRK